MMVLGMAIQHDVNLTVSNLQIYVYMMCFVPFGLCFSYWIPDSIFWNQRSEELQKYTTGNSKVAVQQRPCGTQTMHECGIIIVISTSL